MGKPLIHFISPATYQSLTISALERQSLCFLLQDAADPLLSQRQVVFNEMAVLC